MTRIKYTNNTVQAAWIALGSLFSVGFGIISAMILSRYFNKEDYGLYKQVLYVYTTLNGFFMLGLPKAFSYFLPKSPLDEAKSLISKLTKLFFILGAILSLLLFFGSGIIANVLSAPKLESLLKIFSPVPFLMMPTLGLEGILATFRETKLISIYVVLTRTAMLLCICLPVIIFKLNVEAALIGFVISSAISFAVALYLKYYPVRNAGDKKTDETYKSIFQFCIPLFIASIWGILINSTDQFFISRYFGNEVFADFSNGAMELPFVGIIIGATSTVLTPLFTRELHEHGDLKLTVLPVWNNAFAKSVMLIYPITVFCLFDADIIMTAMYGEQYIASADFFRIKLFTYFFKIIVFYSLIVALGATKFYQKLFFVFFIILVLTEYIFVKVVPNPLIITGVHVFYTILSCIAMMLYIAKALHISVMSMIPQKTVAFVLLSSLLSCISIQCIKIILYSDLSPIPTLCIDAALMAIIYFGISTMLKLDYISILKPLIKK